MSARRQKHSDMLPEALHLSLQRPRNSPALDGHAPFHAMAVGSAILVVIHAT